MVCKAADTTHKISDAFGPGTVNEGTVQWWFKSFAKETRDLENEVHTSQPSEVDNTHTHTKS